MKFSDKLKWLLLAAFIIVLTIAVTESAHAVPYKVCNNSTVPVVVTLNPSCGPAITPTNVTINPGDCFTWDVCGVGVVVVNGVMYAMPPMLPWCYPPPATPPNQVCFTGSTPDVNIL